jgi:hypothetical protein
VGIDFPGTALLATATSGRARTVCRPFANLTVRGARTGIADTCHEGIATFFALVHGSSDNLALTALSAMPARFGAVSPGLPLSQFTVDRAVLRVALLGLSQGAALLATVQGGRNDDSVLILLSTTACSRACAPWKEL